MEHPPGPEQPARTPAPSSTAPIGFRTAGDCRIPGSPPPAPRLPSHPDPAAEGQARLPLQLQVRPLRALPRTRAGHRGGPKSTERLQAQPEDARTRSPGWPGRGAGAAPSRKHHSPLRAANAGACPDSLSARWGWPSAPPCSRALGVPVRRVRSSRGKRGRSSSSGSGFQSSGAPACSTRVRLLLPPRRQRVLPLHRSVLFQRVGAPLGKRDGASCGPSTRQENPARVSSPFRPGSLRCSTVAMFHVEHHFGRRLRPGGRCTPPRRTHSSPPPSSMKARPNCSGVSPPPSAARSPWAEVPRAASPPPPA